MKRTTLYPSLARGLALTAFVSLAAFVSTSHADITYVDALQGSSGNTFGTGLDGNAPNDTNTWLGPDIGSGASNTQWTPRTFNGAGGTIYQALTDAGGSIPELTTQVSGLADGTYDIWVYYTEAGGSNNWFIDAGFTSGSLTTYEDIGSTNVVDAGSQTFTNQGHGADFSGGAAAYIGQQTVSGGSAINVFINHPGGNGGGNRTVYNGVGYSLVAVPEPGSVAMLGLGAFGLLVRRRR